MAAESGQYRRALLALFRVDFNRALLLRSRVFAFHVRIDGQFA